MALAKAQPPAPRAAAGGTRAGGAAVASGAVHATKTQDDFDAAARELAAALGWEGEDHWILNRIQVSDARNYLRKVMHERHVASLNPHLPGPSVDAVCEHLGLTDAPKACALVAAALDAG